MENGSLVFIDFDPVGEKPAVHVLFGESGNLYVGDSADDDANLDAPACGLHHLFAEKGAGHKVGGKYNDVGVSLAEHFYVATGDLVKTLDPVIAADANEAFLFGDDAGEAGKAVVFSGPVDLPVGLGPHVAADDMQLERSLAFYEQGAVEPGGFAADVVVTVADVDAAGHTEGSICDDDFVVHTAAEVEMAAFEQGPEPAELDAGGFPTVDDPGGKVLRGVAVEENKDLNLAAGGAEQGGGDELTGLVAVKNIGLEVDGVCCFVDQLYQGGKVVGTAVDETDFVVECVSGEQSGRSCFSHRSDPSGEDREFLPGDTRLRGKTTEDMSRFICSYIK